MGRESPNDPVHPARIRSAQEDRGAGVHKDRRLPEVQCGNEQSGRGIPELAKPVVVAVRTDSLYEADRAGNSDTAALSSRRGPSWRVRNIEKQF